MPRATCPPATISSASCHRLILQGADYKMEITMQEIYYRVSLGSTLVEGKGRKQDWVEGETETWCHLNEASVDPVAISEDGLNPSGLFIVPQPAPLHQQSLDVDHRGGVWLWARRLSSARGNPQCGGAIKSLFLRQAAHLAAIHPPFSSMKD